MRRGSWCLVPPPSLLLSGICDAAVHSFLSCVWCASLPPSFRYHLVWVPPTRYVDYIEIRTSRWSQMCTDDCTRDSYSDFATTYEEDDTLDFTNDDDYDDVTQGFENYDDYCGTACDSAGCYGETCDYWATGGYSCNQLETYYSCSCTGCECPIGRRRRQMLAKQERQIAATKDGRRDLRKRGGR